MDALFRSSVSSVEWTLQRDVFRRLSQTHGTPQVDPFTSRTSHHLPVYVSRSLPSLGEGLVTFTLNWNRWTYIFLFPPPLTNILLNLCATIRSFRGQVILITPYWKTQPWYCTLCSWCSKLTSLRTQALNEEGLGTFERSLQLLAWTFPDPASGLPSGNP